MMTRLEKALTSDGYNVIGKDLISMGCSTNLIEKRKIEIAKKTMYDEADVIIPLICEDGFEGIFEAFGDKKIIPMARTLGVGAFTPDKGRCAHLSLRKHGAGSESRRLYAARGRREAESLFLFLR